MINLQTACLCGILILYVLLLGSKLFSALTTPNKAPFLAAIDKNVTEIALSRPRGEQGYISDRYIYWSYVFHKGNPDILYLLGRLERDPVINTAHALRDAIIYDPQAGNYRSFLYDYDIRKGSPEGLLNDMKKFGGKGVEPAVASAIYKAGLQYAYNHQDDIAETFIRVAAEALPESSYIQIERAAFELSRGNRLLAETIIDNCSKNIHSGDHCREVKPLLNNGIFPPPGFYNDKFFHTVCFGKKYPESVRLLNSESCATISS